MHKLARALVALSALLAGACMAQPPFAKMEATTGTLLLPSGGTCSATAVGPSVIATAAHCMEGDPKEVRFRGINMAVVSGSVVLDGRDHALVRVDADLGAYADPGPSVKLADRVWIFGNPMGLPQLLREGFVAKVEAERIFLECRCWGGDSGAGIFNDEGQLVGIYTGQYTEPDRSFSFPAYWPWAFTDEQWREARR